MSPGKGGPEGAGGRAGNTSRRASIGGREERERGAKLTAPPPPFLSTRSSPHKTLNKLTGSLMAQHRAPGGPAAGPPALGTLAATRPVARFGRERENESVACGWAAAAAGERSKKERGAAQGLAPGTDACLHAECAKQGGQAPSRKPCVP